MQQTLQKLQEKQKSDRNLLAKREKKLARQASALGSDVIREEDSDNTQGDDKEEDQGA